MNVLHVDASARQEGSHSRSLSAYLVSELRRLDPDLTIDRLDLTVDPPRHFGALETAAISCPVSDHTPEMRDAIAESDALVARVLAAEAMVIGTPIYNFGMPSTLKAFFDHISRNGLTFLSDETGMQGLISDKKVAVISVAGGAYGPDDMFEGLDGLTPHVRAILGFMGVTNPEFISARPMLFASSERADAAMSAAKTLVEDLAQRWV